MKTLVYTISINAKKEKVWETMFGKESYTQWTELFHQGSYFEGSWEKNTKIKFLTPEGEGMLSEIAENKKFEFVSIRHLGTINNDVEDTESPEVKAWTPALENYTFFEKDGITAVKVELVTNGGFGEEMDAYIENAWPKALNKLKQMCEA